eukprot:c11331_g1_i1.p1 GENE.c11331_g1_i1~~c11331_g1_i1.p1  ORF type:complete len:523 (+),score=115.50 c11331_g1_i1:1-1569(+)
MGRGPVTVVIQGKEELHCDAVLVTVPLGVLKRGSIAFDPPLSEDKKTAIKSMGYGIVNKVALIFATRFWSVLNTRGRYIGFASDDLDEFSMFVDFSDIVGSPTLVATVSGNAAVKLEGQTNIEIVHRIIAVLAKMMPDATVPQPISVYVTRWGMDEHSFGSASYFAVNTSRKEVHSLTKPTETNRVFFAGEATSLEHPATVHGAFMSGIREARNLILAQRRTLQNLQLDILIDGADTDYPHPLPLPPPLAVPVSMRDPHLAASIRNKVCALCGLSQTTGEEGTLIGPVYLGNVEAVYVHEQCASCSPEVGNDDGRWYNVAVAVRRGRDLTCQVCKQKGATIGCFHPRCETCLHFRCCISTGWNFDDPKQGKIFYCRDHRSGGNNSRDHNSNHNNPTQPTPATQGSNYDSATMSQSQPAEHIPEPNKTPLIPRMSQTSSPTSISSHLGSQLPSLSQNQGPAPHPQQQQHHQHNGSNNNNNNQQANQTQAQPGANNAFQDRTRYMLSVLDEVRKKSSTTPSNAQ